MNSNHQGCILPFFGQEICARFRHFFGAKDSRSGILVTSLAKTRASKELPQTSGRHRLVQLVYNAILAEVTEGRLPPDARLIQDELAQAYGVSRQPVQQALLLLRDHGVVLDAPRRGFVVSPLSAERVRHQYQVRAALDGAASRLAALQGRTQAAEEGPSVIEAGRLALESGSIRRMIDADTLFHTFVSEISGNPIIVEMMVPHYSNMERTMAEVLREDATMPELIWRQHIAILDAITIGNPDRAERLAREHVEDAAARILMSLEIKQKEAAAKELRRRVRPH
jgi:DNA-binding GntR family transcriptional regulator